MGKTPIMATAIVTPSDAVQSTSLIPDAPSTPSSVASSQLPSSPMTSSPPESSNKTVVQTDQFVETPATESTSNESSGSSPQGLLPAKAIKVEENTDESSAEPAASVVIPAMDSTATVAAATAAVVSGMFTWENYLLMTNSKAAKPEWFYQSRTPLVNNFVAGHKLVMPDPRGLGTLCLATIIRVVKAWICVRLDGEDSSNDHWMICDDELLSPVQNNGEGLQPPVGFTRNPANFHAFLSKQLAAQWGGKSALCPEEWFKPIDRTLCPKANQFKPGMKCELVERRNFSYAPCAVTVTEVNGDWISFSLDGASDWLVKEKYYSRYIFPCGFGELNGTSVIPPTTPQPKRQKRRSNVNGSAKAASAVTAKPAREPRSKKARLSEIQYPMIAAASTSTNEPSTVQEKSEQQQILPNGGIKQELISEEGLSQPTTPGDSSSQQPSCSGQHTPNESTEKRTTSLPPDTVAASASSAAASPKAPSEPIVPPATNTPPSRSSKRKSSGTKGGKVPSPRLKIRIGNPPPSAPSQPDPAADQPSTSHAARAEAEAFASMVEGSEKCTDVCILPGGSDNTPDLITVHINHGCAKRSSYLEMLRVMDMPRRIGPTTAHHLLREVIQGLCNATMPDKVAHVFHKIPVGNTRYIGVTVVYRKMTYVRYLPCPTEVSACVDILRTFIADMQICPNFITTSNQKCRNCYHYRKRHAQPEPEYHSWSVQKMADYVTEKVNADMRNAFAKHDIDGKALSLLNQELIEGYMSIPAGQAAKILDIIRTLENEHKQMLKSLRKS